MAYHRDGDFVILLMDMALWERLVLSLMVSAGLAADYYGETKAKAILDLANRLNEGNPEWWPWKVD